MTPGTHWKGGWVGPSAILDTVELRKSLAPARNRTPVIQAVARRYTDSCLTELIRKHFHMYCYI
jgi:hypothetical protein